MSLETCWMPEIQVVRSINKDDSNSDNTDNNPNTLWCCYYDVILLSL